MLVRLVGCGLVVTGLLPAVAVAVGRDVAGVGGVADLPVLTPSLLALLLSQTVEGAFRKAERVLEHERRAAESAEKAAAAAEKRLEKCVGGDQGGGDRHHLM